MAKRFISTTLFDETWFHNLTPQMKLAWCYVHSKCDNAGVYNPNKTLADFQIGTQIKWDKFIESAKGAGKIEILKNGDWWLTDFVSEQCGTPLSIKSKPHQSVIKLLKQHGILDRVSIDYGETIHTDKDMDMEKNKDKNKKIHGELIENFYDFLLLPENFLHLEKLKRDALNGGFPASDILTAIKDVHLHIVANTGTNETKGTDKFSYPNTKYALLGYFEKCLSKGPLKKPGESTTKPRKLNVLS